jgi:hypothetical protein
MAMNDLPLFGHMGVVSYSLGHGAPYIYFLLVEQGTFHLK